MNTFIEKYAFRITVGAFLSVVLIIGGAVWQTAIAYSSIEVHEMRIQKLESVMESVATKTDIQVLKDDLKDYINKH